jgi:hypothetical protein
MKYLNILFLGLLSVTQVFSQVPCPNGSGSILITPNKPGYCPGDNINFVYSTPHQIAIPVLWSYSGGVNNTMTSGYFNSVYDLQGVLTSGIVAAKGQLMVPGTGICDFNDQVSINVAVPGIVADAGPDKIYVSTPVAIGNPPNCGSGGTAPYTYLWTPGNFNSCNPSVSPGSTTAYVLTITDAYGCFTAQDNVTVSTIESYMVPKKTIDGSYQVPRNNIIYFMFEEEYVSGTLNYKIIDYAPASANGAPVNITCPLSPNNVKNLGHNKYSINLANCTGLSASKFYLVEITNDKQEKFYFKFLN